MINMLANCLRELQYAIKFIVTAFPIQSQWEATPLCDIKFIATFTLMLLPLCTGWVADSCGLNLLVIFIRDCHVHNTIAVVYQHFTTNKVEKNLKRSLNEYH